MFGDIGWAELMLIGIVALIVIGPEDLPHMFRQLGRFTAKMRSMSRDFSRAMEQAAKESGVKDVSDSIKGATSATSVGLSKVKAAADRFEKWDPINTVVAPPTTKPGDVPGAAAVTPTIHGSETQALLDKQVAKKAILLKTAEDLKAVSAGTAPPAEPKAVVKRKTKIAEPAILAEPVLSAPKPSAARKPKKAAEA